MVTVSTQTNDSCKVGVPISKACPGNCRTDLRKDKRLEKEDCKAVHKLEQLLYGQNTLSVGASAFHQAPAELLEEFSEESEIGFELVSYFLLISSPEQVQETVREMSNPLLYRIVKEEFDLFMMLRKAGGRAANFLDSKMVRYWRKLPESRVVDFIMYCVRGRKDPEFASRFLYLLSGRSLLELRKQTGITVSEEKELYSGLQDSIYEFPIHFPEMYPRLMEIFSDDPEISIILSTMAALVERKEILIHSGEEVLRILGKTHKKLAHQSVLDYLLTLDQDAALEILSMLEENKHLSSSEKELLSSFLRKDDDDSGKKFGFR
ncbi:hypothetical protein EHO60_04410 [Leptospira fletcheri]|uniref:Uncharacterized protein n=1 Tax=Leptospira fletcheri TaxID=2484981 RepID=A0A4R9GFW9_9LEPT|nr:hypothetical protein EHO60_04410 [Leptospira fletcheri]